MPHCASSFKATYQNISIRIYCVCSHHVTCTGTLFRTPTTIDDWFFRCSITGLFEGQDAITISIQVAKHFMNLSTAVEQVPVCSGWLHGRMASVSYQFRFCWVDASLMFTDWTPFGSWLCGNNGALSILNFSVISTWVDRHVSQVQTGQTQSIGSCLFYTILPPAWCISLLILSMVPSPLSFFPDPSASCRLRLSSCRATAATQME